MPITYNAKKANQINKVKQETETQPDADMNATVNDLTKLKSKSFLPI